MRMGSMLLKRRGKMAEFRLKCPKNYPLNCSLLDTEKASLERTEKFKAFLMYQFKGQGADTIETIKSYFRTPTYYVFDAQKEAGLGPNICKICRLALASDFGIAVLTPFNYNVFLEIGLLMGLGKKSVYIVSKGLLKKEDKIPFDLSDQLVIEYSSMPELSEKLEKEIPSFVEPIGIITGYDKAFREHMEEKLRLDRNAKGLLKLFTLQQGEQGLAKTHIERFIPFYNNIGLLERDLLSLEELGFIKKHFSSPEPGMHKAVATFYKLEEAYRPFLQEYFWKA